MKTRLIISLALTLCASAHALGEFQFIGEALYLRPSTCDAGYVLEDATYQQRKQESSPLLPMGKVHRLRSDYNWGFRTGVGYVCEGQCFDAKVTYARLTRTAHDCTCSIDDAHLWPMMAPPALLSHDGQGAAPLRSGGEEDDWPAQGVTNWKAKWSAVQGEVGSRYARSCNLYVRGAFGFHWADISSDRDAHVEGTQITEDVHLSRCVDSLFKSSTWGIGPQVSVDAQWDIGCNFGLKIRGGGAILVGQACHRQYSSSTLFQPGQEEGDCLVCDIDPRSRTRLFPELEIGFGFNHLFRCGNCWSVLAELGYEFRTYISVLDHLIFDDTAAQASNLLICDNFSLDGLYLKLMLRY